MDYHIYASDIPKIIKLVLPDSNESIIYQNMDGNGEITIEITDKNGKKKTFSRKQIESTYIYKTGHGFGINDNIPDANSIKDIQKKIETAFSEMTEWDPYTVRKTNIYGDIQSGKSSLILAMIWKSQYVYKKQTVLILSNMTSSYHQMISRDILNFNRKYCTEFPIVAEGLAYVKNHDPENFQIKKPLLIVMGNPTQLKRLFDYLDNKKKNNIFLFVDEADQMVKHVDSTKDQAKTSRLYKKIEGNSESIVAITATPFALFNELSFFKQKTIVKKNSPKYRSFKDINLKMIPDSFILMAKKHDYYGFKEYIYDVVNDMEIRFKDNLKYASLLINIDSRTQYHDKLARVLSTLGHDVFVINSNIGIRKYNENGVIKDIHFSPHVGDLYNFFETNSIEFSIKIIIAGFKASRAVSFRPNDETLGDGGINATIYLPSDSSHMSQQIQAQRSLGNYNSSFPKQDLYTSKAVMEKLNAEMNHNIREMVKATTHVGTPRKQIEGLLLYDIGTKHDRTKVDDTILNNKMDVHSIDYIKIDDIPRIKSNIVMMTECFKIMEYPNFTYTSDKITQSKQRQHIKAREQAHSVQICWAEARYEQLHSIKQRFNKSGQYNAKIIGGNPYNMDLNNVPIVRWKDEFCKDGFNDWNDDTMYVYHTTKNTFRVFTNMIYTKTGYLQHEIK